VSDKELQNALEAVATRLDRHDRRLEGIERITQAIFNELISRDRDTVSGLAQVSNLNRAALLAVIALVSFVAACAGARIGAP
jgi:ferric-dicitrate binding protein FerR (iron transport regulator)